MSDASSFPDGFFARQDESDDALFYALPRFVVHIDEATIAALTDAYRELLPPGGDVLDLMSSCVSHLPDDVSFGRVAGLGMNQAELAANARLTEHVVHDLNREPELPYAKESFDAVVNAVSIQYLTRPVEVLRSVARVLRPGGLHLVALSHRCFPTKAIQGWLATDDRFHDRHIGPRRSDIETMLETLDLRSLDELVESALPASIRMKGDLELETPRSEHQILDELRGLADRNTIFRSFIGMGYHECLVPPVIQRGILENPAWYTAYTPYQAEISQGRLEALLNFQTLIADLTGLPVANASLLDEATAAAEAMP